MDVKELEVKMNFAIICGLVSLRISSGASNEPESGDRDLCASPLTEERLSRCVKNVCKIFLQKKLRVGVF